MVSILINGACGKMGRALAEAAAAQGVSVVAGVDRYAAGAKAYYPLYENINDCKLPADVVVDFSRPDALHDLIPYCTQRGMGLVLATTGYSAQDMEAIQRAAQVIPVFKTANMSLGINVMLDLVRKAAMALPEFDIEIVEKHHNAKVDAPSGTALLIADAMKEVSLADKTYVFGRHTKTQRRQREEIGIHAVRGGTVTGDHEVYFFGNDETIEIKHSAASRRIFALGALQAAAFLQGRKPGLYDMRDVLLEKSGVTNLYADAAQTLLTMRGLDLGRDPVRVFESLAAAEVNVDMISQTAPAGGKVDLSFTIARADLPRAKEVLGGLGLAPEEDGQVCKIVIEGNGMERQPGVAAGVFGALGEAGIAPRLISTSETKIGVAVSGADAERAVQIL
ncbi:MAG: 4-hydroxy-tetrahydrodipicolinate reductase, partial [Candidatus Spyradocola sp.]